MSLIYLLHGKGPAGEGCHKHLSQVAQGSGYLEEKRIPFISRAVFEGRNTLVEPGTLHGHDLPHYLEPPEVLGYENQVVAGSQSGRTSKAKGQYVVSS